jgi:hypothetical protein
VSARRSLAVLVLLTFCALWVPSANAQYITGGPAPTVGTFPPPIPTPLWPDASEVLLDVAAHRPNLLIRLNTYDDVTNLNIDPFVRVRMYYAIAYGSWILTTRTVVTSGKWTGRPWLAIGGHARYFYFAYEQPYDGSEVGDMGGVVGAADAQTITQFGKDLTAIGMGVAQIGKSMGPTPAGKAVTATGLGMAGTGLAISAIGMVGKVTEQSPKTGHVDGPVGMPGAGGPPGSDPNGPTGQSPPGAVGVVGGGVSGGGGEGGGGDVGDPGDD